MRFLSSAFCALLFLIPNPSFAQDTQSGVEQLRQFVRISKTAEGEFVQQQLRAPKPNEPQDKGLKVFAKRKGVLYSSALAALCGIPKSPLSSV